MNRALFVPMLLALTLSAACGQLRESPTEPGGDKPPADNATFTRVQNEVFTPSCALSGCHDSATRQRGMSLEAGEAYSNIVGKQATEVSLSRIAPGDPAASYLYMKVTGAPGIIGERMPFGRTPLTQEKLDLIRDWIRRGAPND